VSCPWGELSMGQSVHVASYPWGELSMEQCDCTAKCHGASYPWGKLSGNLLHLKGLSGEI
jgi:hypothetical protein